MPMKEIDVEDIWFQQDGATLDVLYENFRSLRRLLAAKIMGCKGSNIRQAIA